MTVLPIVERELGVAARRPATYWLRFWAALGALVVFGILRLRARDPATLGHDILNALGVGTLGFCMFAGVFLTADSLSVEKRDGTLGLLFLTDLKGFDVVLGKLAADSLHAIFGLLAVLPILALPLLSGGASGGEYWRLVLVFLVTLFFSLSVGILVSAVCTDARQAMAGAMLWVLIPGGVFPALWWLVPQILPSLRLDFLLWPSPAYAYLNGFDARYLGKLGPGDYWHSLEVVLVTGFASVALASFILPRLWSRIPSESKRSKTARRQKTRRTGRVLDQNPFYWLVLAVATPKRSTTISLLFLTTFCAVAMIVSLDGSKAHAPTLIAMFTGFGTHLAAKVLIASESSRRFNNDRQSGALELVLVTPLRPVEIMTGHRQALGTYFKGALWALGLINVAMMFWILSFPTLLDMHSDDQAIFLELFFGGLVVLLLDFRALAWLGMWNGLNAKNHPRAVLRTVGQIMALPWVGLLLLVFLEPRFGPGPSGPALVFGSWFVLGIIIDVVLGERARRLLTEQFRQIVTQNYRR